MSGTRLALSAVIALVFLLQGCGGGGGGASSGGSGTTYSGVATQATVDAGNADALARAGAAGAGQSVASENTPMVYRSPTDQNTKLRELSIRLVQLLEIDSGGLAAKGAARTDNYSSTLCPGGGTAYLTVPNYADPNNYSFSFEFSNCADDSVSGVTYIYTGTVDATYVQDSSGFSFDIDFQNFSITIVDSYTHTATINLTMSCSGTDTSGYSDATCTYHSDFTGFDGRVYRIKNVTVTGDGTGGYDVTATVYHPDYGYVTVMTTDPLFFDCTGGYPSAGTLVLTGSGSSTATVTFDSCSQYSVTYNSTTTPYTW